MGIMSLTNDVAGQTNVVPRFLHMQTSDTLSTITTAGYLNKNAAGLGYSFTPTDIMFAAYNDGASGYDTAQFELSFATDGTITLQLSESSIALPTIANHIAVFTDTAGSLGEDATTAINGGNIQAGLSGTAGTLASYPATASKGSLKLTAVANTGDTVTTISNVAMGQASVVSIPDPASATGRFVVGATATPFVSGNIIAASGTGGLAVDGGIATSNVMNKAAANQMGAAGTIVAAKVNGTEAANAVTASGMSGVITTSALTTAGAGNYAITWTNTFITGTSTVLLSIQGGTNTVQNIQFKIEPGAGTATLTIYNNTAATALDGTILIGYLVM